MQTGATARATGEKKVGQRREPRPEFKRDVGEGSGEGRACRGGASGGAGGGGGGVARASGTLPNPISGHDFPISVYPDIEPDIGYDIADTRYRDLPDIGNVPI